MQRLVEQNINTPQEYNRIFKVRQKKGVDLVDLRRWKELLKYYKGGKLLDMGCLDSLVPIMAKGIHPKAEVWGLDHAEEAVQEMQAQYRQIHYHVGDIYDTKFRDGYFNYVVMGEVLEHLENPEWAIKEAVRTLTKGGTLAISTPLDEAKEVGAVDHERHLWSFTQEDLREMLEPYGKVEFKVLRSIKKPEYIYCWPQLLAWVKRK